MVTCLNQNIITNTEEKQISPLSTLAWSAGASTTESGLLSRKKEGKKENPQQTQPGHFTQNRQEDWKHSPPMSEGTAGISVLQTPLQLHKTWGDNFSICWRHTRKHTHAHNRRPCNSYRVHKKHGPRSRTEAWGHDPQQQQQQQTKHKQTDDQGLGGGMKQTQSFSGPGVITSQPHIWWCICEESPQPVYHHTPPTPLHSPVATAVCSTLQK